MKKVLLINGSPNEHGCTDVALQEVADTLEKNGVESEILWLGKKPMQDCIACFKCQETGKCVFGDSLLFGAGNKGKGRGIRNKIKSA